MNTFEGDSLTRKAEVLCKKNLSFLKTYPYIDKDINFKKALIEETSEYFEVVFKNEKRVKVWKAEEFDYDSLLKNPILEIDNLLAINVYEILNRIIRSSEFFGADNKVYLFYDEVEKFLAMTYVMDFSRLFAKSQFYILLQKKIVRDNDKEVKKPSFLDVRELNSIVFFYQPQNCGYKFFKDIIQQSSYVIYVDGWRMHRKVEEIENFLGIDGFVKKIFLDNYTKYRGIDFLKEICNYPLLLNSISSNISEILEVFSELFSTKEMNISDLMKALLISKWYYDRKGEIDYRIVPLIVFFPDHYERFMEWYAHIKNDFLEVIYFRLVRDPIVRTIRAYEFNKKNGFFGLNKITETLTEEIYFYKNQQTGGLNFVVRFEDLKKEPRKYLFKICNCFKIPFEDKLIENGALFIKDALSPALDKAFSEKDKAMLKILYKEILVFYGYSEEIDGDIQEVKNYMFDFEEDFSKTYGYDVQFVHMAIESAISDAVDAEQMGNPVWLK